LESVSGVLGGLIFDSGGSELLQVDIAAVFLALQVGETAMRKTNRVPRDLSVIYLFFGDLFVKGGCTVYLFNISYLLFRKKNINIWMVIKSIKSRVMIKLLA